MHNNLIHAQGAVAILKSDGHLQNYVATLNINPDDFALIVGDAIWLPAERQRAQKALDALIFGAGDMVGMSRETFTAEWIATMIVTLVKPFNWYYAVSFMANTARASSVITANELGNPNDIDATVNSRHLLALCHQLLISIDNEILTQFRDKAFAKVLAQSTTKAK